MRKILVMLTLITLFVSCQKGAENSLEPTPQRVTITPAITRATELAFESGDKIGLTIIKQDQSKHVDNAPMTHTDGLFIGDVAWYEGDLASNMVAYYPYSTTGTPTSFTVSSDQTSGYAASDLMGAVKPDVVPTTDAVGLIFKHLLSKIVVNVKQTDANISSVTLQNSIPTATVDLANLTVAADQSAATASIVARPITANSDYRAIIVPQTVSLAVVVTTAQGKIYTHKLASAKIESGGQYSINIEIAKEQLKVSMSGDIENWSNKGELVAEDAIDPTPEGATAYITKVLDFMPAIGQFTNDMPKYVAGDTQETMNAKVLAAIGHNKKGMISLGGFGGYVVVGFDHTIANVVGKRDFRVIANAFYSASNPDSNAPDGGSCEPGVIMVAYDANKNGVADEGEWYEIAGSSHQDPTQELWYQKSKDAGNDVNTYFNYEITYHRPAVEPTTEDGKLKYIFWEDNQGNSGYKTKNQFHNQCYYPLWATGDRMTFRGTRLPQNGIDESGEGNYFVLYKFGYGYADNELNAKDESAIDISWAVNTNGERVHLPGVDFVKIYTGVNQENGWLGETSTEITGVEDLHILGIDINTRK